MGQPVVTIFYNLHVSQSALSRHTSTGFAAQPRKTLSSPLPNTALTPSNATYYHSLAQALRSAINEIGLDLTAWRDAVSNDERDKEIVLVASSSDEGEDPE
ncbi:uncharacterized protein EI90DRAFT_1027100 [Cantharellus anzutake]|uniref:uncharacterized protein n=1 Tax=Cantharellus anzutake TaxID=1750568 RepID=UPI001908DC2B|nr:uncharacterized protein EI90DRAFT_1027100 [Cantharellus anzutake]KAF8331491.1 hypothetical protein EI90DRAFT_1027100 [Cantharellus anzutake]